MESTIFPGVGIGKVKLGMTLAQVERALGKNHILNAQDGAYTELAWNFASWTAGFEHGRVVQVGTTLRTQRTTARIGPGTFWLKLVKAFPGGLCTFLFEQPYGLEYLVPHKGGTQTIFLLHAWPPVGSHWYGYGQKTWFVINVAVRTPFQPRPEFARNYPGRCKAGYQKTPLPTSGP